MIDGIVWLILIVMLLFVIIAIMAAIAGFFWFCYDMIKLGISSITDKKKGDKHVTPKGDA